MYLSALPKAACSSRNNILKVAHHHANSYSPQHEVDLTQLPLFEGAPPLLSGELNREHRTEPPTGYGLTRQKASPQCQKCASSAWRSWKQILPIGNSHANIFSTRPISRTGFAIEIQGALSAVGLL